MQFEDVTFMEPGVFGPVRGAPHMASRKEKEGD